MATLLHTAKSLEIYTALTDAEMVLPLAESPISAGFPSPAADFVETGIDLNKELIKHQSATFLGRVTGQSMIGLGIDEGDILVIDKSLEPMDGKLAVCAIDGDFTLKQIRIEPDCVMLMPANEKYKPIRVTADNNLIIWGIVTYVIKKF
jgi:DNA polymerase V